LRYESLVLLRSCLLAWGMLDLMSQIIHLSWEHYFVSVCLPWDWGCMHFVVFTSGLCVITTMPPSGTWSACLGWSLSWLGKLWQYGAIWSWHQWSVLLIIFYTRYIRVYLLEYMLYTKVNFIGDDDTHRKRKLCEVKRVPPRCRSRNMYRWGDLMMSLSILLLSVHIWTPMSQMRI
jgi:hypothetical protein